MTYPRIPCPLHHWMPRSQRFSITECGGNLDPRADGAGYTCNACHRRFSAAEVAWLTGQRARQAAPIGKRVAA